MKTAFVFVGSNVSDMMGVVSFRKFGQRCELTDEQARDLASGGAAIAPAEQFDALAIPEKLLRTYAEFGTHGRAPAEFLGYKALAIAASEEFRESHHFVIVGPADVNSHFGQIVWLTSRQVSAAIAAGVEIVPKRDFDEGDFTALELFEHAEFRTHEDAGAEFLAKKNQLAEAYRRLCASLTPAPTVVEEPTPSVVEGEV